MQTQAKQFIELLEKQQLLSPEILDELRRQIAESKTRLTTELLAKLLVDNGHLTKFQATKLIAELREPAPPTAAAPNESYDEDDELGLAPGYEDDDPKPKEEPVAEVFMDDDEPTDAEIVDVVEVVEDDPVEVVEVVEVADPATAAAPLVSADSGIAGDFGSAPRPASKVVRAPKSKSNPWDSFRILGAGLLLGLLLIGGFFLVYYFWRGNAEDRLQRADDAYEQRSYETASNMYQEFAKSFPANEKASYAKVRAALAALRKDSEGAPDPTIGLATALEVLPPIAGESGLTDQQSDLAGALIALAGKFNDRADRTQETAERKSLMEDMDKLLALINDPQFVGATQRNQQAPTLDRIREDRERILREINRDEDLVATLGEIDSKLEAKDTLAAYEIRKQLIGRYPLLEANPKLAERVQNASVIQRGLVEPGQLNIQLSQEAPATAIGKSFILANRAGQDSKSLAGRVLFVKVKGSVYGIDGTNGSLLWRQFVGRDFDSDPIRLSESASSDALVCQPAKGHVSRVAGESGETQWFADLGTPIHTPVVEDEDLFVATFDGTVASLDLEGGQTKWATKLPQPIAVRPGAAFNKPHLYVPADHSNLYVLSRSDGSCKEVNYLGHRAGAITVPPVLLLGQLFIFENIDSQTSKIRILSTSDDGLELKESQPRITIDGNIVVRPKVDGRRLVVQSDLGQIVVLDVEPTAESQKVTELANLTKNALKPRLSWLIAENNQIWVTENQFMRFNVLVTTGKIDRAGGWEAGDQFLGPPQKIGDVIVHTRTLRGNQGVRVAAVDAETGQAIWETDLGSPVVLLASTGSGYDAVNSSGMYFSLGNTPIRNEADANPGQGKPTMLFTEPTRLSDGRVALFNQSRGNQIALYTPSDPKLRLLSAGIGTATPSCEAVAVGDKLAVGLDNGQFVLLDPNNGALAAAPYQPSLEPGKKVRWNTPAYIESEKTLIVSSDRQRLARLSVGGELRALTEVDLEVPLSGPLLLLDKQVVGIESTRAGDTLRFFDPTSLKAVAGLALPERRISGPFRIPTGCLIQTDSQIVAVSPTAEKLWSIEFPKSKLVAPPVEDAGQLILATQSGTLWIVDPQQGEVVGNLDAGQAFSSAPLALPAGLLVGSDEGAVLALPRPTTKLEEL